MHVFGTFALFKLSQGTICFRCAYALWIKIRCSISMVFSVRLLLLLHGPLFSWMRNGTSCFGVVTLFWDRGCSINFDANPLPQHLIFFFIKVKLPASSVHHWIKMSYTTGYDYKPAFWHRYSLWFKIRYCLISDMNHWAGIRNWWSYILGAGNGFLINKLSSFKCLEKLKNYFKLIRACWSPYKLKFKVVSFEMKHVYRPSDVILTHKTQKYQNPNNIICFSP